MAKVRSSLGEIVDFDMMKIMSELNAPPVRVVAPQPVATFATTAPVVAEEPAAQYVAPQPVAAFTSPATVVEDAASLVVKQPETKNKR